MAAGATRDILIGELQRVANLLGRAPTTREFNVYSKLYSHKNFLPHFKIWSDAVEFSGFRARRLSKRRRSRDELIGALRDFDRCHGRPPSATDLATKTGMPPCTAYEREFGSIRKAFEHAGLSTAHFQPDYDHLSDDDFLAALRELARRIGRSPDRRLALYLKGFPHPSIFRRRFGGWNLALQRADLPVLKRTFRATDGHMCKSPQERKIDNFFTRYAIPHYLHPIYPRHPDYNPRQNLVADWMLEDGTFVEYFGVVGVPSYDERRLKKVAVAASAGVRLIALNAPMSLGDAFLTQIFKEWMKS